MGYSTITQLGLIVISIVIIFTYIKPTFEEIGEKQESLMEYSNAVENASEFNNRLRELLSTVDALSGADRAALQKFLPTTIDEAQVLRDLEYIAEQSGVTLNGLEVGSGDATARNRVTTRTVTDDQESVQENFFTQTDFSASLTATHEEFERFLMYLEANAYIFEITTLMFGGDGDTSRDNISSSDPTTVSDSNSTTYDLVLRVHQLNPDTRSSETNPG